MKNEEWEQVETIFHRAISLDGEQRVSYLSEACSGDAALLSEVGSLIQHFESESKFLEQPAFSLGMSVIERTQEKSLSGQQIGFYGVLEKLGGGGMGDVYLAEDTRLNRKVALKFLKGSLLDDKWAKRQLIREAQAVAMLNHPNICHVHSIEEIGEHNFIVMQYIEGATLAEFIGGRGQLDIREILSISRQIVSAVAAAHSHGIIHRDIKPGNIIITNDGQVKVLDFGLAKIVQQKQKAGREDEHTSHISGNGLILGTVSYMSPEQLRAEKLDYRTDIFSVGIVLYELLGRQNPFNQKSQAETIAAILGKEPPAPLGKSSAEVPDALAHIVRKCLKKDKENRFQSAVELLVELESVKDDIDNKSAAGRFAGVYRYAAALLVLLIFAAPFYFFTRPSRAVTLAVLPISGESERDYLSDGLTANLIDKLSRLSNLKVVAHPLVSKYKNQTVIIKEVGGELSADAVLVGKIVREGGARTLKISLVSTADETTIWSEDYSLEGAHLTSVEEKLPWQVIAKLDSSLSEDEKRRLSKTATSSQDALDLYFRGRFFLNEQYGVNLTEAIKYFEKSIAADPRYAAPWAGLAEAYTALSVPSAESPISPQEAANLAKSSAKQALEIDKTLPEPYNSLAMIELRHGWNWAEAENNFKTAISLDPEHAPAHYGYSFLLVLNGRFAEALEAAKKARDFAPAIANSQMNLARINYYSRNFDESVRIYESLAEKYPDNPRIQYGLGLLYLQIGKRAEATEILEKVFKSNKRLAASALGYAYAKTGRKAEAAGLLAELDELAKEKFVSSQEKAFIYFGLDDKERAFEYLNKACGERFPPLPGFLIDPLFDEFHQDARFGEVRKCANIPAWLP